MSETDRPDPYAPKDQGPSPAYDAGARQPTPPGPPATQGGMADTAPLRTAPFAPPVPPTQPVDRVGVPPAAPAFATPAPPRSGGPYGPPAAPYGLGYPGYPAQAPQAEQQAWGPVDSFGRPVRQRQRVGLAGGWVALLVVLALLLGLLGGVLIGQQTAETGADAGISLPQPTTTADPSRSPESVAGIAAATLPSVVYIEVIGADGVATGSGFVLSADGYILTNNHVIAQGADGAGQITVVFADGSQEAATVVGRTSDYDLAVLEVDRDGLPALALGDSDQVVVGDPVIAVGAPLGLEGTVTSGIVSALNRPVSAGSSGDTAFINAIQTDAAINPGNSGGPLVNANGEVVGVNSAIAQTGGAFTSGSFGLGFAIPSNQARRTAEQLIATGRATYPIIGVVLDTRYTGQGVLVIEEAQDDVLPVSPGGPADQAGIQPGDVILSIDGRPVTDSEQLIVAIRAKAPGDTVVLRVRSGTDERDVRVVLSEADSN